MQPLLAYFSCGKTAVAFRKFSTLGIRNGHRFRGRCPSARTLARLRIAGRVAAPVARLASGRGGYPFAGRDSHPLDDAPNFMNSSHDSLPSDQPFLVALKVLRSGSRIRPRLVLEPAAPAELSEFLGHACAKAGNPRLLTQELVATLAEHAAGNYRVLCGMAADLLAAGAEREAKQLDEKLFLEIFAPPERVRIKPAPAVKDAHAARARR